MMPGTKNAADWTHQIQRIRMLGILILFMILGCGGGGGTGTGGGGSTPPVTPTIVINVSKSNLTTEKTLQATAVLTGVKDLSVSWSLEGDPGVASIDNNGLVTALTNPGKIVIKAQSHEISSLIAAAPINIVAEPKILEFTSFPKALYGPALVYLYADTSGGSAQIEGIGGSFEAQTLQAVQVDSTKDYKLTVTNLAGDSVTANWRIGVLPPPSPVIDSFKVEPLIDRTGEGFQVTANFNHGVAKINGVEITSGQTTRFSMPSSSIFQLVLENNGYKEILEQRVGTLLPGLNYFAGTISGPGTINGEARSTRLGGYLTSKPGSMANDDAGNVYFNDGLPAIRVLRSVGNVELFAGSSTESGTRDGYRTEARFVRPAAVAVDAAGNVWCADNNSLRVVRPTGQVETIRQSLAPTGFQATSLVDNLYWDKKTNSLMYSINIGGGIHRVIAKYKIETNSVEIFSSDDRYVSLEGLVRTMDGTFLVVDSNQNAIFEVTDAGVAKLAYQGTCGIFCSPSAIIADPRGRIFLGTLYANNIYQLVKINNEWTPIWITGLTGFASSAYVDGSPLRAAMGHPSGLAFWGDKLLIMDSSNLVIRGMDPNGNLSTIVGESRPTTDLGLKSIVRAVAVSREDKIYVASPEGIQSVDNGGIRKTIYPLGDIDPIMIFDQIGNFYLAMHGGGTNLLLKVIRPSGSLEVVGEYSFETPFQLSVDANGNLIFATLDGLIRKIKPSGAVEIIAGNTSQGFQDGPVSQAKFLAPIGAAVDSDGTIYVSDYGNKVIRKISPAGIVSTIAGSPGVAGSADGMGSQALFSNLGSIYIDSFGDLLVCDSYRVRKVTKSGNVSTYIGSLSDFGLKLGPLPGSVTNIREIGFISNGDLLLRTNEYYLIYVKR